MLVSNNCDSFCVISKKYYINFYLCQCNCVTFLSSLLSFYLLWSEFRVGLDVNKTGGIRNNPRIFLACMFSVLSSSLDFLSFYSFLLSCYWFVCYPVTIITRSSALYTRMNEQNECHPVYLCVVCRLNLNKMRVCFCKKDCTTADKKMRLYFVCGDDGRSSVYCVTAIILYAQKRKQEPDHYYHFDRRTHDTTASLLLLENK